MIFDVAFLDVGHGDCAVITLALAPGEQGQPARTRCIVVDGGDEGARGVRDLPADTFTAAQRLASYLKLRGIRYIDLLIATHIDSDHIGGLVTFLKDLTGKSKDTSGRYWNAEPACIGRYWGPLGDENWPRFGPDQTDERRRYQQAVKLLVKLKLKKKEQLTREEQAEIDRLDDEIRRIQYALGLVLDAHASRTHRYRSVQQNADLTSLLQAHVAEPEQNITHPDLLHPPAPCFDDVQIELLWPDIQVADTMQEAALTRPVNIRAGRLAVGDGAVKRRPADMLELLERILDNQEQLAQKEDRKANNRSLVVRMCPVQWAGSADTRPVVLFTGDAESESWERMVRGYRSGQLGAYILKVPHHGSAASNGLTPEAYAAIAPRFAIISVGQIHRLPAAETLNLLRGERPCRTDVFCTERNRNEDLQAACCAAPAGCIRTRPDDYRGLVFSFDTDRGSCSVVQLQLENGSEGYRLRPSVVRHHEADPDSILWCRQTVWPPSKIAAL